MSILLVYATNSGSTQAASEIVKQTLENRGFNVTIKIAGETEFADLTRYDGVVLGSPSWDFADREGAPHEDFIKLIDEAKGMSADGKKYAIFGLGDSSYSRFCGAVDDLEQFIKEIKGTLVTPSLKIDGFYFQQEENTKLLQEWANNVAF